MTIDAAIDLSGYRVLASPLSFVPFEAAAQSLRISSFTAVVPPVNVIKLARRPPTHSRSRSRNSTFRTSSSPIARSTPSSSRCRVPRSRSMVRARRATPCASTPAASSRCGRTRGCSPASTASSPIAARAMPARAEPGSLGSASINSISPLGPYAGAADRDVLRAERPTVLRDVEGDIERDVRVLFGDLHQDLCLHQATIVDGDG